MYFLGSLTSQSVYGRLLQVYSETRHYQEYPWKLSQKLSRPTSQFMMLTLSNLFDRPANYFTNLTVLKLSGECINTRLNVIGGRGGHAVTHLMASLAHSCPVLEIIDFSDVTSLYPEAIVYLCYQDAYQVKIVVIDNKLHSRPENIKNSVKLIYYFNVILILLC